MPMIGDEEDEELQDAPLGQAQSAFAGNQNWQIQRAGQGAAFREAHRHEQNTPQKFSFQQKPFANAASEYKKPKIKSRLQLLRRRSVQQRNYFKVPRY